MTILLIKNELEEILKSDYGFFLNLNDFKNTIRGYVTYGNIDNKNILDINDRLIILISKFNNYEINEKELKEETKKIVSSL